MFKDIDFSKPLPQLQLFLCKNDLNRTIIGKLTEAYNKKLNIKLSNIYQLDFSVPYQIDQNHRLIDNPNIDNLIYKYIIKAVLDDYEDYFIIDKPVDSMTESDDIKNITCYSQAYELKDKNIRDYNITAKSISQIFNGFTDENNVYFSSILSDTNWTLGYVDGDAAIKYRGLSISSNSLLDVIFEIGKVFDCVVIFNNVNKTVNYYNINNIGSDKGLRFNYGNLLKTLDYTPDFQDTCSRLKIFGANNITINKYNPSGQNYLESFVYYTQGFSRDISGNVTGHSKYLEDGTCIALDEYQTLLQTKETDFNTLLTQLESYETTLTTKQNELTTLQNDLVLINDDIDSTQASNNIYENTTTYSVGSKVLYNNVPYKCIQQSTGNLPTNTSYWENLITKRNNKENEITTKESEINTVNTNITNINNQISTLRTEISWQSNFTANQITELKNYIVFKEITNNAISNEEDLYNWGKQEFIKLITPITNVEISVVNLLSILEEQYNWNKLSPLNVGDIIRVYYEKINVDVSAKIVEMNFDFENQDCNLVISNVKELKDDQKKFIEKLYKSINTSSAVDLSKYRWNNVDSVQSDVNKILNEKWSASLREIQAGVDESVDISRRGITISSPLEPLKGIRMTHGVIGLSTDGFNTLGVAIDGSGVYAERLVGQIIAGENLTITTGNGDFLINETGVFIENLTLNLTRSDNKSKIIIDPTNGIKIQQNVADVWTDKFYVDTLGVLHFDGAYGGNLNANQITTGILNVGGAVTIQGTLNTSDVNISGTLSLNNVPITDLINDFNVNRTGQFSGNIITNGTITAGKMNVTNLAAINANLGTVTAGTISTNTTINVGTNASVGNSLSVGETITLRASSLTGGIKWTGGSNVPQIYYDQGGNSLNIFAPNGSVYANGRRIDTAPVAVFG